MTDLIAAVLILIFVCIGLFIFIKAGELILKNRKRKIVKTDCSSAQAQNFKVGQVYQMEDGSLAKYSEDGKFYKVK